MAKDQRPKTYELLQLLLLFLDFSFDLCIINSNHSATPSFSPISLSLFLPPTLSLLPLPLSLSLYLSLYHSISLSLYLSLCLSLYQSTFLPIHISPSLPTYLPFHPSIYYSQFLSVNRYFITADPGAGIGLVVVELQTCYITITTLDPYSQMFSDFT